MDEDNNKLLEDKTLQTVGLELMFSNPQKWDSEKGITAIELSKKLKVKLDIIKKKLRILQDKEIIRSIGVNPKYWQFDDYNFQRMDESDPVYSLLCNFEDIDFDQFFDYVEQKSYRKKSHC